MRPLEICISRIAFIKIDTTSEFPNKPFPPSASLREFRSYYISYDVGIRLFKFLKAWTWGRRGRPRKMFVLVTYDKGL